MLPFRPEPDCAPFAMPATTKDCQSPRHQHPSPILGYTSRQSNNPWSSASSQSTTGHHHGRRCLSLPCYYGGFALPWSSPPHPLPWLSTARQWPCVHCSMPHKAVCSHPTPRARSGYAAATVQPVPQPSGQPRKPACIRHKHEMDHHQAGRQSPRFDDSQPMSIFPFKAFHPSPHVH